MEISLKGWRFGLEDYLIAFALTGISSGVFEFFAHRKGFPALPRFSFKQIARMAGWELGAFFILLTLGTFSHLSSINSLLLTMAITSFILLSRHKKILPVAFPLAILSGAIYWLFYIIFLPLFPGVIEKLWNPDATWGIMLLGVPPEEFLWVSGIMLVAGPVFRVSAPKV